MDDTEAKASVLNTKKLTDRQKLAMSALTECILSHGESVPAAFGLPGKATGASLDCWREEMTARGIIDADSKNPRAEFKRIKDGLAARQLIGLREGLVWPAKADAGAQSQANLARKARIAA